MQRVILTKGLPGSGKSTWAKEQVAKGTGFKRVSKDDLRAMIDNGKWSKSNEKTILKARDALILALLREGFHVIVDDTNLDPKHLAHIQQLIEVHLACRDIVDVGVVEVKDFTNVPLEECIKRDQKRPNYVGEKVIRSMWRQYLAPKVEPPVYDIALPDAIICDLDGTLALLNGRNPYDASTCEEDILNLAVHHVLGSVTAIARDEIILVSGRMDKHRPETESWLADHDIAYDALYMRATNDTRKDAIVKREIYEQHIKGRYNIRFVLDDRNQVVEMWRSLGLTCLQVADGDF